VALSVLYGGFLVRCLTLLGRFTEAAARGRDVLRAAETTDRPIDLVHACSALGSVHLAIGEFADAAAILERGLQLCRAEHLRIPGPALVSALGTAYVSTGRITEGLPLLEEAVGPSTALEHHFTHAGLTNLGWGYLLAGRPDEATEVASRALALACERHDRGAEAHAIRLLGEITAAADPMDVPAARERFQKGLEIAQELEMLPLVALCHFGLGRLHERVGDRTIAQDHLTRARSMFLELGMRFYAEQSAAIGAGSRSPTGSRIARKRSRRRTARP
jgi:tetratricopeptide (TPR) repeat protein